MGPKDWFARWFGEEYTRLYPHRDAAQADLQVEALLRAVEGQPAASSLSSSPCSLSSLAEIQDVLDIGCGAGRHLAAFRNLNVPGFRAVGIDLSPVLLRDARADGLSVARADMRRLPFADGRFDLVTCFFTSFGYFETAAEDAATLGEFARVVRPGGLLFLDLPNRERVLRELVPAESTVLAGSHVDVTRHAEDDLVVKRIRIHGGDAGDLDNVDKGSDFFEERVRLYSLPSLGPVLSQWGLEVLTVLGDERGAAFEAASSARMSLLLRARPRVGRDA
jgi:SAM-dependent methyltransferase